MAPPKREDVLTAVGLPVRAFMFTIDQVEGMLGLGNNYLAKNDMLYYYQRTPGRQYPRQFKVYDIAKDLESSNPVWRIAEREVIRWCKAMGLKLYERGYPKSG